VIFSLAGAIWLANVLFHIKSYNFASIHDNHKSAAVFVKSVGLIASWAS